MHTDEELVAKLWLETNKINQVENGIHSISLKKYKFNQSLVDNITLFTKTNKITWTTLLHTAWAILLHKLSTTNLVVYGTLLTNITPIKAVINDKLTVKNLYKDIRAQLKKNGDQHENVDDIRYLFITPNNNYKKQIHETQKKIFPLILIAEKKNHASISIRYQRDCFTAENIKRIKDYLTIILKEIIHDFNQKIVNLNFLNKKEKEKILHQWPQPTYSFPIPHLNAGVHEIFASQATLYPYLLAISHQETEISYGELHQAVIHLTHMLKKQGVKKADPVCVIMERTPSLIMVLLAILNCEAIYVPINPKYPEERIEYILQDCQTNYILSDNLSLVPSHFNDNTILITQVADYINFNKPLNVPPPKTVSSLENIAYILYTSGTTGNPKGVIIKHTGLINLTAWYQSCFNVTTGDRFSQFASQGFDTYLCEVIPALLSGASVHIVDDNIKLTPALLFNWLIERKITIADFPTAFAKIIFSLSWPKKMKLRLIKIGGESINRYPTQSFCFDIWNTYGPTETTIEATYAKIYSANQPPSQSHLPPPIGKPIANSKMYIVDKYLHPVPVGVGGELLIGGTGLAAGYLNLPEITKEKFILSSFTSHKEDKERFYRTGDLVRWLNDGNIEFIGRVDNQVKIRGYRIELSEIEHALTKYADVNEAAVIIKNNESNEKSLVAYVVPNLDKARLPFQERCLISVDDKYIEAITEDISKEGAAIYGMTEAIAAGKLIKISLKLPGTNEEKEFLCRVIWKKENKCGLYFEVNNEEKNYIAKSVDYYLSTHNVMEVLLNLANKRNLRKALQNKLPDYMIPGKFFTLLKFPLTFSGKIDTKSLPVNETKHINQHFVPPSTPTEKKLAKIWCDLLGKEMVSMADNFFDIGGNSILTAELTVRLFKEYNISIPVKVLFDLPFIPILAEYIDTKGKQYHNQTAIQHQINVDTKLDESLQPSGRLSENLSRPKHILLTGAGGFLGIYLLRELLNNTQAKIYCLVRKGNFETPAQRFMETIKYFQLEKELSLANRRIIIIASDLSKEQFGLTREQYHHLANKINIIYHCGAQVNIMSSYDKLRGSNVQGTIEIIKFAITDIDKPIHYISTLSSANRINEAGELVEKYPNQHYDNLFGGYAISKWVSERLLTSINRRHLPISIYRLGYISGQSNTGVSNLNDALLMLIKGCIQLGLAPCMKEKITILPVDFVSRAIISIANYEPHASNVYHIDHPTGIMWIDLIAWLNDYGYQIKLLAMDEWKNKLVNINVENALYPFLPYYLTMQENIISPNVNIHKAKEMLDKCHLTFPDINDHLLGIYFDYFCKINFLPSPQKQINIKEKNINESENEE